LPAAHRHPGRRAERRALAGPLRPDAHQAAEHAAAAQRAGACGGGARHAAGAAAGAADGHLEAAGAATRPVRAQRALIAMRYPLPYAFARSQQLLLEDDGERLVLWHAGTPAPAWSEVMRKYSVRTLQQLEA